MTRQAFMSGFHRLVSALIPELMPEHLTGAPSEMESTKTTVSGFHNVARP